MIELRPVDMHWIEGGADDPTDLCAHGQVLLRVDGDVLIEPSDGDFTVSASAIYLMRTLSRPHTRAARVGEHLFPCCGRAMSQVPNDDDVMIVGCSNGIDLQVTFEDEGVVLTTPEGKRYVVSPEDWQRAVFGFVDEVAAFYRGAAPKRPHDEEDRRGFERFLREWQRRRGEALTALA